MPLTVTRRDGKLTISGRVNLPDGTTSKRIRARAATDNEKLAKEQARAWEAQIIRDHYHGKRRGVVSLAEAVTSYVEHAQPKNGTKERLNRIMRALGDVPLG